MRETLLLPAERKDRDALIALSSRIWEGKDYLLKVIDDWLSKEDPFLLLWDKNRERLIGCAHLAFFGSTAWLEGVRVDPAFQRKGYGGALFRGALLEAFRKKADRIASLIYSGNVESLHLAKKHGFDSIGEPYLLEAEPLHEPWKKTEPPLPIHPREIGRMRSAFCEFLVASNQYWHDGWLAYPEADHLKDRFLFSYPDGSVIAGICSRDPDNFTVSAFTKPGEWLAQALEEIRRWAGHLGCQLVTLTLPQQMEGFLPLLEKHGFLPVYDEDSPGELPARVCLMEYNPYHWDAAIVQAQLGLSAEKMSNYTATSYRCGYGFPAVVECFPLQNGKPFPTSHYLTCPHLRYEISRLEESGEIKRLAPLFDSEAMRLSHGAVRRLRWTRLRNLGMEKDLPESYTEALSKGIGGIRDTYHGKCLHLHTAVYLTGISNPAGQAVIDRLKADGLTLDCKTMRCAEFWSAQF